MANVLHITLVASLAPGEMHEWTLQLPLGATVADALLACGLPLDSGLTCGIWGRVADNHTLLHAGDRVECCRPLQVDPKLARRQRFARQGARAAGLFAASRPGGKAGY